MERKSWRNHLWIVTCVFFVLGLYDIAFAWLGLVFLFTPLLVAIMKRNKAYCNKYCDRGRFFRFMGEKFGLSRGKPMPAWMKSRWFRYLFMVYFFGMFGSVIAATWLVATEARELHSVVKIFQALRLPLNWTYSTDILPAWSVQFAFGFYSIMLTSFILGIITMLFFKPRSWCVFCPVGTMTQGICRFKRKSCASLESEVKKFPPAD